MLGGMAPPDVIDLTSVELASRISDLGARVDALWREALTSADFVELDRLTNASQALHRAALALQADALIGA